VGDLVRWRWTAGNDLGLVVEVESTALLAKDESSAVDSFKVLWTSGHVHMHNWYNQHNEGIELVSRGGDKKTKKNTDEESG
jgi:hypothetical protein